jgi:putative membrane-bound dehydrogenase-like protein
MLSNYIARWLAVWFVGVIAAIASGQAPGPAVPDTLDKDYSAELPRSQPLSPEEALRSFEIVPGFRVELVAAEPLVTDPVAISFDEKGRMYVVEMRGYSENRQENLSRIRLLEDTDGDGQFEKSTVFAEGLLWPTAIHCWQGGVFVADAPDLLYLKDTTGDGVADEKRVVLTGFGTSNVQGLVNTMQWSLDNKLVLAISSSGAVLRRPDDPPDKAVTIRGRDIALDPRTMEFHPITGGAQHGATWDRWGNRFVCSNSDHIQHCVIEDRYLARNPYLAAPNMRCSIAVDGPQADVYRISPLEPWRIVRTRLRVNKVVPGIVEGGGRPGGYFTGATGVTIYDGDAWPEEYKGVAFIGDVGSNIVHRKRLAPVGASFKAERIDEKKEFLASRDTWFRPVQFANAPDGCLYVLDMYRETIEHPASIPPILKKHLDLTSGRDRGRIYRVVHDKITPNKVDKLRGLAKFPETLPELLTSKNGWVRETAARLLYERGPNIPRDELARLEKIATNPESPEGRIRALYLLSAFNALSTESILTALDDTVPQVREHAVRLAEILVEHSPVVRDRLLQLTAVRDFRVRFQLALSLGFVSVHDRIPALVRIWQQNPTDADLRTAILSSLNDGAGLMLAQIAADEKLAASEPGRDLIRALAVQIGKQHRPDDIALLVKTLAQWSEQKSPLLPIVIQSLAARQGSPLAQQIALATGGKAAEWLHELLSKAIATAQDDQAPLSTRIAALRQLRLGSLDRVREVVEQLLSPTQPAELQIEAIALLGSFESVEGAQVLLARLAQLTPVTKNRALDALLARDAWSLRLLQQIEGGTVLASELDPTRWKLLSESSHKEVRTLATKLAAANRPVDRLEVLQQYRSALEMAGDADRGKDVFKKNCAACHRVQGLGHEIGPNLAAMKSRGPEAILMNVLDPNREVNPQYLNYLLLTTDGRSLSGILTGETATSVTLKKQENATDTVLRVDIESLRSTGQSLMPVGIEKQIDRQGMADLLEYLKSVE